MFLVDWPGGSWQATLQLGGLIIGLYLAAIWVACVFWTYRDIRQRTRDPILQVVAVLLVVTLFLPGLAVYLILRPRYTLVELYERSLEEEALLQELEDQKNCPTCKRRVLDDFLVCPSCRTQLKEPCPACSKPLSYAWLACPYCGMEKAARERPTRRRREPALRPAEREPAVRSAEREPERAARAQSHAKPNATPNGSVPASQRVTRKRRATEPASQSDAVIDGGD